MPVICGIDEAGRGPLAGPVTAAAVVLREGFPLELLDDSKKLSPRARERALGPILGLSRACSVGWAWPAEIDELNILRASLLAMRRAYEGLGLECDTVYVDGTFDPGIPGARVIALPKADATIPEVMAASILAKEARDRWMLRWDWIHPGWDYARHKGYPTAAHRRRIAEIGPSPIQRRSFAVRQPGEGKSVKTG